MSSHSALFLFAPVFSSFGCDVAKTYCDVRQGDTIIHGLCTGPASVRDDVASQLGALAGQLWLLEELEKDWLQKEVSTRQLATLEEKLGVGHFGQTIISDRRIGRGFVHGGLIRPDKLGAAAINEPNRIPQIYVHGLYSWLEEQLDKYQPEIVFCYAVAGAPAMAMAILCKIKNVRFARLTATRIGAGYVVDADPRGHFSSTLKTGDKVAPKYLEEARQFIHDFREKPSAPEYYQQNIKTYSDNKATKLARSKLQNLPQKLRKIRDLDQFKTSVKRSCFEFKAARNKKGILKKYFSQKKPQLPEHFIFYPLHVEPEASTMVLSPMHTDQINVIEALAKSAPAHMKIVVKEHLPMVGKRPAGFYDKLLQMPGVQLIGPFLDSLSCTARAELVAVITGTAAWEAMLLQKPTLIVGDSPFLPVQAGVVHEPNLANLPAAIYKALILPPAEDEKLEKFIAILLSKSFDMPASMLWDKYERHEREMRENISEKIAAGLLEMVGKSVK